jgi:hypothetical protein
MVRWVTPLLLVGTSDEARQMGDAYVATSGEAISHMSASQAVVVPTREMAAEVIRHFGATEEWVQAHVIDEWKGEPVLDS